MRITVALATSIVALLAMANPGAAQAPEVSTALTSAELIACFEERGLRENVNYVIPKRGAFTPVTQADEHAMLGAMKICELRKQGKIPTPEKSG